MQQIKECKEKSTWHSKNFTVHDHKCIVKMDGDAVCWRTGKPLRDIPCAEQRRYIGKGLGIIRNGSDALWFTHTANYTKLTLFCACYKIHSISHQSKN